MSAADTTDWTWHADPRGFALALPPDWELLVDPRVDVAFVALEPTVDPWGFRTNVLVTLDNLDRGMTLGAWQDGADKLLPAVLKDYLLLDREDVHVGPGAGVRRLAHHDADGRAITMEQWATVEARCGITVTASVSTLAYPTYADRLTAIGTSLHISPTAESNGRRSLS